MLIICFFIWTSGKVGSERRRAELVMSILFFGANFLCFMLIISFIKKYLDYVEDTCYYC